jgi:hypothetical protein
VPQTWVSLLCKKQPKVGHLRANQQRGRRLSLTVDDERIAAFVECMEKNARAIDRAAEGARSELTGDVTIKGEAGIKPEMTHK